MPMELPLKTEAFVPTSSPSTTNGKVSSLMEMNYRKPPNNNNNNNSDPSNVNSSSSGNNSSGTSPQELAVQLAKHFGSPMTILSNLPVVTQQHKQALTTTSATATSGVLIDNHYQQSSLSSNLSFNNNNTNTSTNAASSSTSLALTTATTNSATNTSSNSISKTILNGHFNIIPTSATVTSQSSPTTTSSSSSSSSLPLGVMPLALASTLSESLFQRQGGGGGSSVNGGQQMIPFQDLLLASQKNFRPTLENLPGNVFQALFSYQNNLSVASDNINLTTHSITNNIPSTTATCTNNILLESSSSITTTTPPVAHHLLHFSSSGENYQGNNLDSLTETNEGIKSALHHLITSSSSNNNNSSNSNALITTATAAAPLPTTTTTTSSSSSTTTTTNNKLMTYLNNSNTVNDKIMDNNSSSTNSTSNSNNIFMTNNIHDDKNNMKQMCLVCGDQASGRHYGVFSCEGCKGFFKRAIRQNLSYKCRGDGNCKMDRFHRNRCQYCRLKKCYEAGMKSSSVQNERRPYNHSNAGASSVQLNEESDSRWGLLDVVGESNSPMEQHIVNSEDTDLNNEAHVVGNLTHKDSMTQQQQGGNNNDMKTPTINANAVVGSNVTPLWTSSSSMDYDNNSKAIKQESLELSVVSNDIEVDDDCSSHEFGVTNHLPQTPCYNNISDPSQMSGIDDSDEQNDVQNEKIPTITTSSTSVQINSSTLLDAIALMPSLLYAAATNNVSTTPASAIIAAASLSNSGGNIPSTMICHTPPSSLSLLIPSAIAAATFPTTTTTTTTATTTTLLSPSSSSLKNEMNIGQVQDIVYQGFVRTMTYLKALRPDEYKTEGWLYFFLIALCQLLPGSKMFLFIICVRQHIDSIS